MALAMQSGPDMLSVTKISVALGFGLVACAGSSTPDVPAPTENDDSRPIPSFGERAAPQPEPEPSAQPETRSTPADRPADKPPECPTEEEPNNEPAQATEFTSCIKGELTGWTDTDNLEIVVPQGAAEMVIDHIDPEGAIQYSVTSGGGAGGSSNMSFTEQAPKTKVKPGTKYVFSLKWDNNGAGQVDDKRSYAIRVAFLH
ncbi:MAG TPA: hypothetical protein VM925_38105 [Labilithrix sp.]|nr:hypothetical protein [Labilithrix sp.]